MSTEAAGAGLPVGGALSAEKHVKALSPRLLHKTKNPPPIVLPPQFPPNLGEPSPYPNVYITRRNNCRDESDIKRAFYFFSEPEISIANTKFKAASFTNGKFPFTNKHAN